MNRESMVKGLMALVVVTPCLALGVVHSFVLGVYLVLAAALLFLLAVDRKGRSLARLDLPGAILLAMVLFTAFQLLPLPSGIVELISPSAFEVRVGALIPLGGVKPSFMPLTLDVTMTLVELGKLLLYLAVYWTCILWTRRKGLEDVLNLVVLAGALASFVLLAHKILLLKEIYGFYQPIHAHAGHERVSAPLLNENHMAAALSLAAAVAIGMAISARELSRRILLTGIAALIGGSVLLTLSRGGIAAFIAGQCVFIVLRLVQKAFARKDDGEPRRQLAWLPLGLALSLGLGLFVAHDAIVGEFMTGDHHKIEMLSEGLPLVGQFPVTGVGRGAFWVGFPLVSDWTSNVTFTHAENIIVQLLVDYGAVFGAFVLLGLGLVMARRLVAPSRLIRQAAALAALVAFGLHNLVDFNIEIPGVTVIAVALLAALEGSWHENKGSTRAPTRRGRKIPVVFMYLLAAGSLAMAVVMVLYVNRHDLDTEERNLNAALLRPGNDGFTDDELMPMLERHPAAWYLPFLAGVDRFKTGRGNPLPWLARALEINPSSASAHLYVGRTLLRAGHVNQAMLEFRLASRHNPSFARPIARYLVRTGARFESLAKMAVDKEDKALLWAALADEFARRNMDEEAQAADLAVIALRPPGHRSLARHARRLTARNKIREALKLAHRLGALADRGPAAALLESEIHHKAGDHEKEVSSLTNALEKTPDHPMLLRNLARAHNRGGDQEAAKGILDKLKGISTTARARASIAIMEGDFERSNGRFRAALSCYRQAFALTPTDTRLLAKIADLAQSNGDNASALDALRKMVDLEPGDEKWKKRLDDLEKKLKLKSTFTD